MNLVQLREALDAALTRLRELRALETVSDNDRAEAAELLARAQDFRAQIESLEAEERQVAELEAFQATPVQGRSLNGAPVNSNLHAPATTTQQDGRRQLGDDQVLRSWQIDLQQRGFNDRQIARAISPEYHADFERFIRAGNDGMSLFRALNESLISDGGALIPVEMQREIIQRLAAPNRVASAVRRFRGSSDSINVPRHLGGSSTQTTSLAVQWLGESGAAAEDTSLENWENLKIEAHRGSLVVIASRSWLEDAAFDMSAWIAEAIADTYTAAVQSVIINGSGVGRPFGILTRKGTGAWDVEGVNLGNPVADASLISFLGELDEQYAENASFVMRRSVFYTQIASLRDSAGGRLYGTVETTDGGAKGRVESTLLGYPNLLTDHMPAGASGANIVVFGDLRQGYALFERVAMSIEPYIDPAIQKRDQVGWYVRFRLGGDVVMPHALKIGVQS